MTEENKKYTYQGEIKTSMYHDVLGTLQNISRNLNCDLDINLHQFVDVYQVCAFTFTGPEKQIAYVNEAVEEFVKRMEVYNFGIKYPEKYNLNSSNVKRKPNELTIEIETPIISHIEELIKNIKKSTNAKVDIIESEKRFLKGKKMSIVVTDESEEEISKVQDIFLNQTNTKKLNTNVKPVEGSHLRM